MGVQGIYLVRNSGFAAGVVFLLFLTPTFVCLDADRFHYDTSGEEFMLRQEIQRKKEAAIEFRKNQVCSELLIWGYLH